MVAKLVVLIFASLLIQDAVSSDQVLNDIPRAHVGQVAGKNNLKDGAATTDHQNAGKNWNWNFGNLPPAENDEAKFRKPFENSIPANDRFSNVNRKPSDLIADKFTNDVGRAAATAYGFNGASLGKARDPEINSRYSVPNRNLAKLKNQLNNKTNRKFESEEYDSDDESDDEDESYDSQSGSSQSYDDDDDLSRDNKYPKHYDFPSNRRIGEQQYSSSFPANKPSGRYQQYSTPFAGNKPSESLAATPYALPAMDNQAEQPVMQTRSLQMRGLRGPRNRRYASVSM